MGNIAAAQLSIAHGIKGPSMTVSTACSSGGDAITLGALLIRAGAADAVVVMAGEAAICPSLIHSLCKTGALSKTGESRPFDKDRSGFVMGEGGGALVLESEEHAIARGARVLADLLGCANNTDAYNTVSPDPEGAGAALCMKLALADAGLHRSRWTISMPTAPPPGWATWLRPAPSRRYSARTPSWSAPPRGLPAT